MSYRSTLGATTRRRARNTLLPALALALAAPAALALRLDIAGPAGSGEFGKKVVALQNGNYVVTDADFDGDGLGAVYFYSRSGTLLSTLKYGSRDDLAFIDVLQLKSGDVLLVAPYWDNGPAADAGAVTFVDADTGLQGTVSAANSLVGTHSGDRVGGYGVKLLKNGNYVVYTPDWTRDNNGSLVGGVGAMTFGRGDRPLTGAVSIANSLVGSASGDMLGVGADRAVVELANGHYVLVNSRWDNGAIVDAGAVTWANGNTGISGEISTANSFVGTHMTDIVGLVTPLPDGNYVVSSAAWDDGAKPNVGAAAWRPGNGPSPGSMQASNALIGGTAEDFVAVNGVVPLSNGSYFVLSPSWSNPATNLASVGAITHVPGGASFAGKVVAANSLIGSTKSDQVGGSGVTTLANGNIVVGSHQWDLGTATNAGAVTLLGPSITRAGEEVSLGNSLTGASAGDELRNVVALANGNYVVHCGGCNVGTMVDAGVATWGDGVTGTNGLISIGNSLVGTSPGDFTGEIVVPLTNGNYVVRSRLWDNVARGAANAGAATWVDGTNGFTRTATSAGDIVKESNSLFGTQANDMVGDQVTPLANGHYVVQNFFWNNGTVADAGSVTWGNGFTGVIGEVSIVNSLIGGILNDGVGRSVVPLPNGNYVVASREWDSPIGQVVFTNEGAVTWANGATGLAGFVTRQNSLTPAAGGDSRMGFVYVTKSGDYIVHTPGFNNCIQGVGCIQDAGLVSFGRASTGIRSHPDASNSVAGMTALGGAALSFDYSVANDQVIVGRPGDNVVTLFDDRLLRDGFE